MKCEEFGIIVLGTYWEAQLGDLRKSWERNRRELEDCVEEIVDAVNDCKQVRAITTSNDDWEEDQIIVAVGATAPGILCVIVVA